MPRISFPVFYFIWNHLKQKQVGKYISKNIIYLYIDALSRV